jgi:hypothetical protein
MCFAEPGIDTVFSGPADASDSRSCRYPLNFTLIFESGSNFWHRLFRQFLYRKGARKRNSEKWDNRNRSGLQLSRRATCYAGLAAARSSAGAMTVNNPPRISEMRASPATFCSSRSVT